jgi:hypothetical protein
MLNLNYKVMKNLFKILSISFLVIILSTSKAASPIFQVYWSWCTFGFTLDQSEDVTVWVRTQIGEGPIISTTFTQEDVTFDAHGYVQFYGEDDGAGWIEMKVQAESVYTPEFRRKSFSHASLAGVRFDEEDWRLMNAPGT